MKYRYSVLMVVLLAFALSMLAFHGFAHSQAPNKPMLGPGYIDTHMHLGGLAEFGVRPDGQRGDSGEPFGVPGSRPQPRSFASYNTAASNLVRMMDERGIEKAMVVTVPGKGPRGDTVGDRQFIIEAVRRHPGRLYLMDGGANLKLIIERAEPRTVTPALRENFKREAEALLDAGAVGFGEMIVLHFCLQENHSYQFTPADHPLFLALADIAALRGVPIDIHMEAVPEEIPTPINLRQACSKNPSRIPASLPAFERLLAHNRSAKIVWQHIGWDNIGSMTIDLLRRMLQAHPNLYLSFRVEQRKFQVSKGRMGDQSLPMPNRIVDDRGRIKPEWLALINDFPNRFMVGSDEFVGSRGGATTEPRASFQQTWAMVDQLPPNLSRKVGRENAIRVHGLK